MLVPPSLWGCRSHWFQLPPFLRALVWKHYRPGQEVTKRPSASYVQVANAIQIWIEATTAYIADKPITPEALAQCTQLMEVELHRCAPSLFA